ncbi:hypothetical protein E4U55_007503 [Claviceps digitariae]|nr:hypothetical protein E4U55_007503 [Claviceps digitariae]
MSVQRTFTLIPPAATTRGDPLNRRHPAQHVRPMTSKQAQKAYKASTRTPPVSRAEQLRRDRAEQERIRKEFEKEKATAKARLARERKKEKESAEREQKKKKGMPLVSVRPSQDTIARFVRGNGSGRKRDCAGGTLEEMSGGGGGGGGEKVSARYSCGGEEAKPEVRAALLTVGGGARQLDLIPEGHKEEEEEEEDIESGLEELLDAISRDQCGIEHPNASEDDIFKTASLSDPPQHVPLEEAEAIMAAPSKPPSLLPASQTPRPPHMIQALSKEQSSEPAPAPSPLSMPAPQSPPSPSPPSPPMSTQAILGNLEDFFPSSSQQARELQDDTPLEPHPSPSKHPAPNLAAHASKASTSTPSPRRRFFTPSGTNELISLAIQRSRRTAALHQIQQQHMQAPKPPEPSPTAAHKTRKPDPKPCNMPSTTTTTTTTMTSISTEKENLQPQIAPPSRISASQESEYGGEWVEDLALELII